MKARRSHRKSTPHGGIVPILNLMKKCKVPKAMRDAFGPRPHWSTYGYDDVFISLILTIMCGGTRLDNITKMRNKLAILPDLKIPSHDTLGRVLKGLATSTETKRNITNARQAKISHSSYSNNLPMNELLVKCSKQLGLFQKGRKYTLDIDATFVSTKSKEARKGYGKPPKEAFGHAPMVCLIDRIPVYINLRSGNASPQFMLADSLKECLEILENNGISIDRVRSDAGMQGVEILEFLDSKGIKFNTRKTFQKNNEQILSGIKSADWIPTIIDTFDNKWDCEICEFPYKLHKSELKHRLIIVRVPDLNTRKLMETPENSYKLDKGWDAVKDIVLAKSDETTQDANNPWVNFEGYNYKLLTTNDHTSRPKDIILEYNKRGGSERNFSYLKRDCGWRIPPFMKLGENAVFLIVAALANNVFRAAVKVFVKHAPGVYENCTLRTFQFVFIDVVCELIDGIFDFGATDIAFEKIC